jgi:hypothetical protein
MGSRYDNINPAAFAVMGKAKIPLTSNHDRETPSRKTSEISAQQVTVVVSLAEIFWALSPFDSPARSNALYHNFA